MMRLTFALAFFIMFLATVYAQSGDNSTAVSSTAAETTTSGSPAAAYSSMTIMGLTTCMVAIVRNLV